MRERAGLIGGDFEIWSDVGSGTEVELTLAASVAYDERAARDAANFQERNQE
jgi:signal transduction histidine kinase